MIGLKIAILHIPKLDRSDGNYRPETPDDVVTRGEREGQGKQRPIEEQLPGVRAARIDLPEQRKKSAGGGADDLPSPIQGNMWKVVAKEGQEVAEGDLICIIEAMKMENEITAHKAGTISKLAAKEGEPINTGELIATITSAEAPAE